MAITVRGVSNAAGESNGTTTTAGTAAVTPTMPPGTANGDRVFLFQAISGAGQSPANWVGMGQVIIGTGSIAAGAGTRRAAVYWRDKDASWSTMPSVIEASATNNSNWVAAVSLTPTAGSTFDNPTFSSIGNNYNTAGTAYTDTAAAAFPTTAGGLLMMFTVTNDNVTSTGGALTQSGATFGTVTERADGGTATGNDVSGKVHTCPVTTGGTAAPTFTLTLSAASQGETVIIQQTERVRPAKIDTLTDDFATKDTAKWTWGAAASVVSQQLNLAVNNGYTGGIYSNNRFDLIGSSVLVKVVQRANLGNGGTDTQFFLQVDSNNQLKMLVEGSNLLVQQKVGGTVTTLSTTPFDAAQHLWWRISESGSVVHWETSPNGFVWSDLTGRVPNIVITNLQVGLEAGYFGTEPSPGTMICDNFNVPPPVPKANTFVEDWERYAAGAGLTPDDGVWYDNTTLGPTVVAFDVDNKMPLIQGGSAGNLLTNLPYDLVDSQVVYQVVLPGVEIGSEVTWTSVSFGDYVIGIAWSSDLTEYGKATSGYFLIDPSITFGTPMPIDSWPQPVWLRLSAVSVGGGLCDLHSAYSLDGVNFTALAGSPLEDVVIADASLNQAPIGFGWLQAGASTTSHFLVVDDINATPLPLINTFTDDFTTGSTPDTAKWNASTIGAWTHNAGDLYITGAVSASMLSAQPYNAIDGSIHMKLRTFTQLTGAAAPLWFGMTSLDGSNFYGWEFRGTTADVFESSAPIGVTRTHTNGDWYRVREENFELYYDYSTNGTSWTNLYVGLRSGAEFRRYVGIWYEGTTGSTATVRIDNLNTAGIVSVAITGVHSDDFNRANSSSLGSNWTARSGAMAISSNTAIPGGGGGWNSSSWNTLMTGDNMEVFMTLGAGPGGTAESSKVILGANTAGECAYVEFYNGAYYLRTMTDWVATAITERANGAVPGGYTAGDLVSLKRTGNVSTLR